MKLKEIVPVYRSPLKKNSYGELVPSLPTHARTHMRTKKEKKNLGETRKNKKKQVSNWNY